MEYAGPVIQVERDAKCVLCRACSTLRVLRSWACRYRLSQSLVSSTLYLCPWSLNMFCTLRSRCALVEFKRCVRSDRPS